MAVESEPRAARPRSFRTSRTVSALMLREMSTTYGRSPGGYLWAILEPVGAIAMLTLVLTLGLRIRVPSLGVNFPLFLATGLMPFLLYQRLAAKIGNAIKFSKPLLLYPGVTFWDAILARFLLQLITSALISYLIFVALLVMFETRTVIDFVPIVQAMLLAGALGLGVGCINCFLFPTFPLWQNVWSILTAPLFIMSTIIYTFEELPPVGQAILWYNPLVHVVGLMRRGFYPTYEAVYVSQLYVLGFALICGVVGLMLLRQFHRDILQL